MDEPGDIVQFEADYQEGVKRAAPRARNVEGKFNYEYDVNAYNNLGGAPKPKSNVQPANPNDPKFDLNNEQLLLAVEEENEFYHSQFKKDDDNRVLGDRKSLQRGIKGESGSLGQKRGESPVTWNGKKWMQPMSDESPDEEDDNRGLFCGICVSRKKPAPTPKSTEAPRPSDKKK